MQYYKIKISTIKLQGVYVVLFYLHKLMCNKIIIVSSHQSNFKRSFPMFKIILLPIHSVGGLPSKCLKKYSIYIFHTNLNS